MYSSAFFFWNAFDGIKDEDRRGKQQQQQQKNEEKQDKRGTLPQG